MTSMHMHLCIFMLLVYSRGSLDDCTTDLDATTYRKFIFPPSTSSKIERHQWDRLVTLAGYS